MVLCGHNTITNIYTAAIVTIGIFSAYFRMYRENETPCAIPT